MITDRDMVQKSRVLRGLLRAKLGVRSATLAQGLRRAGRRLPRGVRAQGAELVRAEMLAKNPKTARQIDPVAVARAFETVKAHLQAIDVVEERKGRALGVAGALAANLIAVAVLFIVWLWWRGYV